MSISKMLMPQFFKLC